MAIDLTIMALVTSNLDYSCDFQLMFDLAFLLPMLIVMHSFIAVDQFCDFLCDSIATIVFFPVKWVCFKCIMTKLLGSTKMPSSISMGWWNALMIPSP